MNVPTAAAPHCLMAFFVLAIAEVVASAQMPNLDAARTRMLKGNYAEARELFNALLVDPAVRSAAAVGLSRCWEAEGENDKARRAVDDALIAGESADLLARRAELLIHAGAWDEAAAAVDGALKLQEHHFGARWVRAGLYRDRGQYDKADAEYRWFVRTYVARNRAGQDVRDADELLIIGLAGAENARWHNLADQFRFILNDVFGDALKADANYWPAENQAGLLLLEKYNKSEALAAFDKALAINPRAADALVGKGRLALQQLEYTEAEAFASRALAVNPAHFEALVLSADVAWACGDDAVTADVLAKARAARPKDEGVLGRLAALATLRPKSGDAEALRRDAEAINPKPGRFYFEMARRLDDRRHYAAARAGYLKAVELFPQLTPARTELGMLALRMGEEATGRTLLTEAFKADPFHVRLSNSLKVLRHLDAYKTIKTDHFVLRFDERKDPVLGRLLAEYLEREYERLARQYNHRPAEPIIVEVFTSHEMFSGRVIAGPDLHTVGATTGRVFAMAAPRADGVRKPFNWARVVRHELTHIFNLDQTHFLVPHWLTEGLAVANEGGERPAEWLRILAGRLAGNDLLNLGNINVAFTRPKSAEEWTLAYCQANLYVEYLTRTHGADVVARLLAAFKLGVVTPDAVRQACGVDIATVETGYREFVAKLVADSGARPAETTASIAKLEALRGKNPDDADLTARLADQYLRRKRANEARELIESVLAKHPAHGPATCLRARLYLEAGDSDRAAEILVAACAGERPDGKALRLLGQIHHDAGRLDDAITAFERGRKLEPYDPVWSSDLAKAARSAGELEKAVQAQADALRFDPDDLDGRRDLAKTCLELEKFSVAEQAAREAIEIDPADSGAQEALLSALRRQGKAEEADRWQRLFAKD